MAHPSDPVATEERFFLTLNSACSALHKTVDEELRLTGLSVPQYTFLRIVEHNPGITAGEAKSHLYSTAPAVAQLVKELMRRDLLLQDRDLNDARRLPLRLTTKGKQSLKKAKRTVSSMVSSMRLPQGLLESSLKNLSLFLSSLPSHVSRSKAVDA